MDGTQHDETPAVLIFHYIAGAKVGANSVFVDTVKVLMDIEEERRHEILINLARPDAATFSKKNMVHTGPIFYLSPTSNLVCRVRFDEVIQVHRECQNDFEFLRERLMTRNMRWNSGPVRVTSSYLIIGGCCMREMKYMA